MLDMRQVDFSNENYEKFSHKAVQTDLEKLKKLLSEFGVSHLKGYRPDTHQSIVTTIGYEGDGTARFVFDYAGNFVSVGGCE